MHKSSGKRQNMLYGERANERNFFVLLSMDTILYDCFITSYGRIKSVLSYKNLYSNRRSSMTKAELIEKMAEDAGVSKVVAGKAIDSFIDGIKKSLKKGNKVTLIGFGTFSVAKRKARKGRNPRTGEPITIKAAKTPKFKSGKAFKKAIK